MIVLLPGFIFFLSTLSAYSLSLYYNIPFHKNKTKIFLMNSSLLIMELSYSTNYLLRNNNLICHSKFTIKNLFLYTLCIEFFHYFLHRIYHTKYLYKIIHKAHHSTHNEIHPSDAFHMSFVELQTMIATLSGPAYFLRVSLYEYFFILYIYFTFAYISHTKAFYKHHVTHHNLLNFNYCMLIPYFDVIFQTYK